MIISLYFYGYKDVYKYKYIKTKPTSYMWLPPGGRYNRELLYFNNLTDYEDPENLENLNLKAKTGGKKLTYVP